MNKLFNAYISRLFNWTIYRIMLLLMLVGGIGGAVLVHKLQGAWNLPYMLAYLAFPHYVGIITGLFNYPLFTNGTIRNQLSVGHKRSHIYLAGWITSNIFAVTVYLVFAVSFLAALSFCTEPASTAQSISMQGMPEGVMASNAGEISLNAIVQSVLITTIQIIFFTTLTQLFCMILKGVKSFLAIYLGNQLIVLAGAGFGALEGKYDIPESLSLIFPTDICMKMGSSYAVHPDSVPAMFVMLAETLIVFIIGISYVRKTDFT